MVKYEEEQSVSIKVGYRHSEEASVYNLLNDNYMKKNISRRVPK